MYDLKFESCKADPDIWYCPATKNDGTTYYEYVLIYIDNILMVSECPQNVMETLWGLYAGGTAFQLLGGPKTGGTSGSSILYFCVLETAQLV
jgi:hypothetical protein